MRATSRAVIRALLPVIFLSLGLVSQVVQAGFSTKMLKGYKGYYDIPYEWYLGGSPGEVCKFYWPTNSELQGPSSTPYNFYCYNQVSTYGFHIGPVWVCPPGYKPGPYYDWGPAHPQACTTGAPEIPERGNGPPCPNGCEGNPIAVGSGNKYQVETDYVGRRLRFDRYYNFSASALQWEPRRLVSNTPRANPYPGVWRHSYLSSIYRAEMAGGGWWAVVRLPEGKYEFYVQNGSDWTPSADVAARLTQETDPVTAEVRWLRTGADNVVDRYDAQGRWISRTWPTGYAQALAYGANGLVQSVTDTFGAVISFQYDQYTRMTSMTDPDGKITTYGWSTRGQLTSVTHPDTTVRIYHYEHASYLDALTGITDEKNVRFATWAYNAAARVSSSEHAGGVGKVTVTYDTTNNTATVVDALNNSRPRSFIWNNGINRPATIGQEGNSATRGFTYDANGNVSSETDYNGVVTTHAYDLTRNLETSRTEAAGTPLQRIIGTTWHATLRLPLTVTEPGRSTTYTYDGNGNRLTKTVTDTTVTPNQSQVWTWTYNGLGQVLTEDGPRTDVNDVTTYAYYDNTSPYYGNLQSITNAASQEIQFTSYNANGQVLTQVDPNGVTTTFVYDSRGRLTSRTTNSKTTGYEYDAVGQMTKVTLPDGNWVSYVYDNAHRLTQIQDKAGNQIVYTLDAMSRRTKEEVKDTQGSLGALLDWIRHSLASTAVP